MTFKLTPPEPKPAVRKRRCVAKGCTKDVAPSCIMCRPHWKLVPLVLQKEIWATYTLGQERDLSKVTPAYTAAIESAVRAVGIREGVIKP